MNTISGNHRGKFRIVLVAGTLLFGGGGLAHAENAATQPAEAMTALPPCHETTVSLPKVDASGDAVSRGAIALRAALTARWRGEISDERDQAAQAAALFAAAGEKSREGAALQVMAAADEAMAHYDDANCELEEAGSIADAGHDLPASAAAHSSLGALETLTRAYDDAQFDLGRALKGAQGAKDLRAEAGVWNNFGNLDAALAGVARSRVQKHSDVRDQLEGDQDKADDAQYTADADQHETKALHEFDSAVKLADQAQDKALAAKAATNAAVSAQRDGDFDAAGRRNTDALERVSSLSDSHEKVYLLTTIGHIDAEVIDHGSGDKAVLLKHACTAFDRAIQCARAVDDTAGESYATGMYGRLYESYGSESDAMALSRRASFLAQKAQSPDSLYLWQWQTARILAKADVQHGDAIDAYDDALVAYTNAAASLSLVRSDIALGHGNGDPRASFREDVGPLYFQLADLLLRRAESEENAAQNPALTADERARMVDQHRKDLVQARDVVERFKSGELEDYFQDACVNQDRVEQKPIAAIDRDTAVIYVIPLENRIELLVDLPTDSSGGTPLLGAGLQAVRVPDVGRAKLEDVVYRFRNELEHPTIHRNRQDRKDAEQLYDWLIRPINLLLQEHKELKIQTLVFVPDGLLRTVPMAAFLDRDNGKYLIEEYATAVTPGLTLMEPKALGRQNVRLLLSGLSVSRFGYEALPSVKDELRDVRSAFPIASKELLNNQFVIQAFGSEIRDEQFTIVHIASHGEFNREMKDSFILAYDDRLKLDELRKLIQPSQFRGTPVELLTLSACRTAFGDDRAALGLAGVAIKAGARSALASLWYANDVSTTRLIADFYHELSDNPGISKAQALQRAQVHMLRDPDLGHPVYWAPFIIIGNWL
jgi:CHAT domain-containing protein